MGNLDALNEKCGTKNDIIVLTSISTAVSGLIVLLAIPLNIFLIVQLLKTKKLKVLLFFKLLLNIHISDLITGLFVSPLSVNTHLKETLNLHISVAEVYMIHISLFFTDAVALWTLTFLSIDRFCCIVSPVRYFKGIKKSYENIITLLPWPLGAALVAPYFKLQYIRQLAVFSTVNITIAIVSLVVTGLATRHKLYKRSNMESGNVQPDNQNKRPSPGTGYKVTRAFRWMIAVFIITYLPTAVTMIYINACVNCNCVLLHIMRDISILSILASSVLRPISFILNLKHLKNSFRICFCCEEKESRDPKRDREHSVEIFIIQGSN